MAKRLDLEPSEPRFFELLYTRVCRPTFHVAHYGIGAALGGIAEQPDPALNLEQTGNKGAADALGLGLVTYAALLDIANPITRHELTDQVAEIVREAHAGDVSNSQPRVERQSRCASR